MEACMHAAQNELLPLRVVVQVLFFEQARAAAASGGKITDMPSNLKALLAAHCIDPSKHTAPLSTTTSIHADDNWSVSRFKSPKSTKNPTLRMKLAEDDLDDNVVPRDEIGRTSRFKGLLGIPTRPKKMFSKLWVTNRSTTEKN